MSTLPGCFLAICVTVALSFPNPIKINHRPDVPRPLRAHPFGHSPLQRPVANPPRSPRSHARDRSPLHDDTRSSTTTTVSSSCNDIEVDGLYYIKPMPSLPVLPVICSNGYAMLDVSLDQSLRSYPSFLTSWDYGRIHTFSIMSRLDDLSSFREWFLPADNATSFRVSPECTQCISGDFGDSTVYYTDSHAFCFSADMSPGCINDSDSMRFHAESCHTCDSGEFVVDGDGNATADWIKCTATHMPADHPVDHDHSTCVSHGLTFHPTLSTVRDGCTCYRPLEEAGSAQYRVSISDLPLVTSNAHEMARIGLLVADNIQFEPLWEKDPDPKDVDLRDRNIVYLSNTDFEGGTYRITQSGTYIVMEDIYFNFNPPAQEVMDGDAFSPNGIDGPELHWYPTREQAAVRGQYPGLYDYIGAYTLGFFAGITVETSYVTIDLNGHSLQQAVPFYFQQRFFALIELASQPFVYYQRYCGCMDALFRRQIFKRTRTIIHRQMTSRIRTIVMRYPPLPSRGLCTYTLSIPNHIDTIYRVYGSSVPKEVVYGP